MDCKGCYNLLFDIVHIYHYNLLQFEDFILSSSRVMNYQFAQDKLYTMHDGVISIADITKYQGGFLTIIAHQINEELIANVQSIASKYAVDFAFIAPFHYCNNEVLMAKTNTYNAELNQELKKYAEPHVDIVHVARLPTLDKVGVIILDMDSTCIQIECIDEIARAYGVGQQIAEITSQAMHGLLDFKQSLRKRVSLLKDAPVTILEDLRNRLPIMPGFPELVRLLQQHNWYVAIASGGFMPFVNKLKEDFNLTLVRANTFEIDGDHLTGGLVGEIVDSSVKVATLHELIAQYHLDPLQSIAIGDGANDLPMINEAGIGFAIHAKPIVREKAPATINNFGLDAAACIMEGATRIQRL